MITSAITTCTITSATTCTSARNKRCWIQVKFLSLLSASSWFDPVPEESDGSLPQASCPFESNFPRGQLFSKRQRTVKSILVPKWKNLPSRWFEKRGNRSWTAARNSTGFKQFPSAKDVIP